MRLHLKSAPSLPQSNCSRGSPTSRFLSPKTAELHCQEQSQTNSRKCRLQLASIGSTASSAIAAIKPSVTLAVSPREQCSPSAVEASVRLYDLVPHHLPVVHDRPGRVAHCARGNAPQDRTTGIPGGVRA